MLGSPPRVRGKVYVFLVSSPAHGITPACAGKSCLNVIFCLFDWDHPRVCGEKREACLRRLRQKGSPPRVRGKVSIRRASSASFRITPACAGKSPAGRRFPAARWDHPRVCGEKQIFPMTTASPEGSPPRVRGKATDLMQESTEEGITPACAGKRPLSIVVFAILRDHPRVCGEKGRTTQRRTTPLGSPPRVRGKGGPCRWAVSPSRITPACAGKRLKRSHRCVASAIILHPVHSVCNRPAAPDGSPAGRGALLYLPAGNAAPMSEVCSLVLGKACGGPVASGRCSGWLGRGAPEKLHIKRNVMPDERVVPDKRQKLFQCSPFFHPLL